MSNHCDLIFVYGTLLDADNAYGEFLRSNSSFIGDGKLKGRLYDTGNYPGATAGGEYGEVIHGSVYRLNDIARVLKELDDYEGFGDDYEQPNEFIRQPAEIEIGNRLLQCWVYFYNHSVTGLSPIISGKYR